jgi:hypothetical protein
MKKIIVALTLSLAFLLGGCATLNYPSAMTETEVFQKLVSIKPIEPKEKIYRQYVSDGRYLQFERIDENNIIYGWYTCTNCSWTRSKFLAIYDGSYMYLTYGHHEEFFLESPQNVRKHPEFTHWSWSVIEKFQIEGRNLIQLGQIRKCIYDSPAIKEWDNAPWAYDGDYNCAYKKSGSYKKIFVSTIDETLAGQRSSIVGAEQDAIDSDIKVKLAKLKDLYEDGLISQEEYEAKRRELLDNL